jgi:hypothetical protein
MKTYTIRDGFSFRMDDNSVKTGGDTIDLDDDVAAMHLHKLEQVTAEAEPSAKQAKPAPAPSTSADSE